jgi:hypothetical protein
MISELHLLLENFAKLSKVFRRLVGPLCPCDRGKLDKCHAYLVKLFQAGDILSFCLAKRYRRRIHYFTNLSLLPPLGGRPILSQTAERSG